MQPGRARTSSLGVPLLPLARWVGWVAPVCPTHGVLVLSCPPAALRVCGVLGHLAPVHRCARSVCCFACAVSWASWLLFTDAPARCVVLRVRCPGPTGSCSPVCPLGVLCWVCGVLGLLAPVHHCARSVCCVVCAASWAFWLLFTGVPAPCVVSRVRRPGPPGSCSPVCPLRVLFCLCGVLGPLAPVHRCARSVCCFACAVSWASWLLFTGVPARCVVLGVRCPGPPGSCSPVCPLGALFRVCGVLGLLAPVHCCARSVCCFACAVSWANWLLFTVVPARCVVLGVRCPGPPGSCSPVCPLGVLCCVCGVLGLLAPVHRCARSVRFFPCAASWATWLQDYRNCFYNRFKGTVFKGRGNHWSKIEKNMDKEGPNEICVLEPVSDAKPNADNSIRAVGLMEEAMREKKKEFQEKGWIVPSQSHWVSRGFLVPKPGTNKWRLVIDYRYVNTQLRGCEFPLPIIEDLFVKQAGNQFWTLLDLEDGFHQMRCECSRQYTAFCTPFAVFEWRVLPMGVKVGPQAFQRMVSNCFKSLQPHTHIYIDDLRAKDLIQRHTSNTTFKTWSNFLRS